MGNSHAKHGKRIKLEDEELDGLRLMKKKLMKKKARADYRAIVSLTEDLYTERYTESNFGRNPKLWLKEAKRKGILNIPEKDKDYIAYVEAFLELVLETDEERFCTPFFILKTVLVTEEELKNREDPMISALRIQHSIERFTIRERGIYHKELEALQEVPDDFAFRLIDSCVSPFEVAKLTRLDSNKESTSELEDVGERRKEGGYCIFRDVLKSKNKRLISSPMFRSLVQHKMYYRSKDARNCKGTMITRQDVFLRVGWLFLFNLISPVLLFCKCFRNSKFFRNSKLNRFIGKSRNVLFTPICSYIAGLMNNLILFSLLLYVTFNTVPDPGAITDIFRKLVDLGRENNATVIGGDELNVSCDGEYSVALEDGRMKLCLAFPEINWSEWTLWLCLLAWTLTELQQHFSIKKNTKSLRQINKIKIVDIVMMLFVWVGVGCRLHHYIDSRMNGLYKTQFNIATDHQQLVSRRVVYTIHFYSMGAIFAIANLFYSCFIFMPGIGPLLRSIQMMFRDLGIILVMLVFFSAGFLMPLYSMVRCYRAVYTINSNLNRTEFDKMESVTGSALTLGWNIFGNQEYTDDLYDSLDRWTTFCLTISLCTFTMVVSVMCMNLLLAMVCYRYEREMDTKHRDWYFSRFELLMYYGCDTRQGMPFIFPLSVPYILFCFLSVGKSCQANDPDPASNLFARLLCSRMKKKEKKTVYLERIIV